MVVDGVQSTAVSYTAFAVFWSAPYQIISALLGVQQEVARAVRSGTDRDAAGALRVLRWFSIVAAFGALGIAITVMWLLRLGVVCIGSVPFVPTLALCSTSGQAPCGGMRYPHSQ